VDAIVFRRTLETNNPALPSNDWQDEGSCRHADADLFFPPFDVEPTAARIARENAAKAVCAECPVRIECLEWALTADEPYGVWGGYSESERRELRRAAS
jgi:WhiB family transcriptional regulator, redox-sensing transcriptional regulator